jgi:glycosyltransferase involved in cell wall biosynthesis
LSLVVPCYNDAVNLQRGVLDTLGAFTVPHQDFEEVLIVDDGSTDASRALIADGIRPFAKLALIENGHQGKALAVISGIQRARGDWVMFSDMDLATPLDEAEKLMAEARGGLPWVRDLLLGLREFRDTQCGFKLFRRQTALDVIRRLRVFTPARRARGASVSAAFDLEFLVVARQLRYRIAEVPVSWRHVETRRVRVMKDSLETLVDMIRIAYFMRSGGYTRP